MTQDPIVQEIQKIRDEVAREHDYDIDAIFEAFRKAEASSGREYVTLKPRQIAQQLAVAEDASHPR